ncbi:MAG: bifunctional 5,10-methylenetetrahydrofolate dehydrogenase/5,10-methenyltetrahydrofolate cyclohydrolase [Aerococcus suis]|nr:bifunctional 5,10-methylenetetrahydrofolate dehydrogenase/5,10-methenyltetrahydrofolate cyclohydrolase [Aerococcus suis]
MRIYRSKPVVEEEIALLKNKVIQLKKRGIMPNIKTVFVGNDPASNTYSKQKQKFANQLGIRLTILHLPHETDTETLYHKIQELNHDDDVDGIMIEMPLPAHIDRKKIVLAIDPNKDCDAIHPAHLGNLLTYSPSRIPNTPLAAIKLLEYYQTEFQGKKAVMVGRSAIVGKPLAELLLQKECTVTLCHTKTENLAELTRTADILCVAIGKPEFITADMVNPNAIVIDIGINFNDKGKLVGDVKFDEVAAKVKGISPVPGGVGPLTNVMLFKQFVEKLEVESND